MGREPFAKFLRGNVETEDRVAVGPVILESYGRVYRADAVEINSAIDARVNAAVKEAVEKFREMSVKMIREHPCSVSIYGSIDSAKGASMALQYIASLLESIPTGPEAK